MQRIRLDQEEIMLVTSPELLSLSPWSTMPHAYAGPLPLRRQQHPHIRFRIYRILQSQTAAGA